MANLPILSLTDIGLAFGGKPLFENVTFTLARGERLALIGRNGAGKSTLMRLITGRHEPDKGELWMHPGLSISTVPQEPDLSAFERVSDYVEAGGAPHWDTQAELDFFGVPADADPATLSGGQIRRAALARAFAEQPDVLLLDEPTNHLDVPMIETLESRLNSFRGAVLLVSHDRRFLDRVTTGMLWLRDGSVLKSSQDFSHFDAWAETVEEAEAKELARLRTQLKSEHHWLARGVTGRRRRNMGRLARLKEMRAEHAKRRAALNAATATADLSMESGDVQSRKVLEAFNLSKRYDDTIIVEGLNLRILRGDRIGVIGPNGVGKTTLLRLLLGQEEPDSGHVKINPALTVTYLDQTRESLNPKDTLWEALAPMGGDSIMVQGRSRHVVAYAGDFLFKPEQVRQPVSALSGGERNRLTLAIALAKATDLLVLDEPTNDLDMQTLDLLEDMLLTYEGTLILVSHDRAFLDSTVTSCLVPLGGGEWVETAGGWTEAQEQTARLRQSKSKPDKTAKKKTATAKPTDGRQEKLSFKDKHRLKELETELPALEAKISSIEQELADPELYQKDAERFARLTGTLEDLKQKLARAEEDWLDIEARREEIENA